MASARQILVRHGETAWNAERRYTTRSDVPLNDAGRAQARAAAEAFATTAVDRVFSSPSARALVTADEIARRHPASPPVVVDERLREVDAGPFEGLTPAEIAAGPLAGAYRRWQADDDVVFPEGAESYDDALARAEAFLAERRDDEGTTVVVTHGSLVRLVVTALVVGAPPSRHRRLWLENGRSAVLERGVRVRLTAFNVVGAG